VKPTFSAMVVAVAEILEVEITEANTRLHGTPSGAGNTYAFTGPTESEASKHW